MSTSIAANDDHLSGPGPKPEKPTKPAVTKAQLRVIKKAMRPGGVRMAGAYGKATPHAFKMADFDTKSVIERCLVKGWVTWGEAIGIYLVTEKGKAERRAHETYVTEMDEYKDAIKAWRRESKRIAPMAPAARRRA